MKKQSSLINRSCLIHIIQFILAGRYIFQENLNMCQCISIQTGYFFDPPGAHSAVCACRWRVPASQWECSAAWLAEEMLLAGGHGHLPSTVSHCSIPKQHSPVPFLPTNWSAGRGVLPGCSFSHFGDAVSSQGQLKAEGLV